MRIQILSPLCIEESYHFSPKHISMGQLCPKGSITQRKMPEVFRLYNSLRSFQMYIFMKKILVLSIPLTFVLVLVACATGGGGVSAAPTDTDLVRALGGKATVNGDTVTLTETVTLTGDVRLEKALVVPEGITLDLTANGVRLFLRDGAVLTVNGTVNARGHGNRVDGGLCIDNGAATINGSGTINLSGKGSLLNIWGGNGMRKLTLDGVTLVGLKDNNNRLVVLSEGGELVMKSGKITGNGDGGVGVYNKSTLTMEDGEISANSANYGGGVSIHEGSTFTMTGGAISGNSALGAGGVEVGKESVFTMKGGAISDNSATSNDYDGSGGGVNIGDGNSTFIMEGGTISGNRAGSNGGGVVVDSHEGGGEGQKFTMSGGAIFGNTARRYGGGVSLGGNSYRDNGTFIMEGGRIQGSTASDGFAANTAGINGAALLAAGMVSAVTKWGMGGTYTMGGVPQTGGSAIVQDSRGESGRTSDTLIAIPAR
jgi:hypothetical protein